MMKREIGRGNHMDDAWTIIIDVLEYLRSKIKSIGGNFINTDKRFAFILDTSR